MKTLLTPQNQKDLQKLIRTADITSQIVDMNNAHLIIHNNTILSRNDIAGLDIKTTETTQGVDIHLRVKKGVKIAQPVTMCFGVLHDMNLQKINMKIVIEENASLNIVGHCIFSEKQAVTHLMQADIILEKNALYHYFEKHTHNNEGTTVVKLQSKVLVGKGADYVTEFELLKGHVGKTTIDFNAVCKEKSKTKLLSRISGLGDDKIIINETADLEEKDSMAVLQSKIAVKGNAQAVVHNTLKAQAANARGHVDCTEILRENGHVEAYPNVQVTHPDAHVTHEATLGGVDNKQLETLMTRGLDKEDAEELIIQGLLARK